MLEYNKDCKSVYSTQVIYILRLW